ncbi:MAG: [4Fe-4S] proteins maturation [Chaenotheca gracillima]|nr:MAG: [4Fe-4S] proteins maturation [Chaenotheca gracillima]
MDRGAAEYSQSGLHSPYPPLSSSDAQSEEGRPADQASAAQYTPAQEVRPANFSSSATPTSEYGLNPPSSRSANFPPEYLARQPFPQEGPPRYHPSSNHSGGSSGGMAQTSSPSLPLADGHPNSHHPAAHPQHHNAPPHPSLKSDAEVPIDPSIAASSPTYPHSGQYSPYTPSHEMAPGYPGHPGAGNMYGRPDWSPYGQPPPHGVPPNYPSSTVSSAPSLTTAGARPGQQSHPLSQVYSFVPIPGAQQHKRPRRRYEEIERMYKCGWQGCEKAYGTLNHLNAHVTMQSHGQKRTPEEFKEIRKEWKARKKEEDNQRKAEEERHRQAAQANQVESQAGGDPAQAPAPNNYGPQAVRPHLPPLAYTPGQPAPVQAHYGAPANGIEQIQQYPNNQMYSNYPPSPYGQGNQMYQQHPDAPPNTYQQ